jgi:endonuclease/exonuclease/phosphatase family metal-dependent hydrolase
VRSYPATRQAVSPAVGQEARETLWVRLVTWNLNGLEDAALDERTEAAVFTAILGASLAELQSGATPQPPPDVIVLQEVVPRSFKAHILPHFAAGGYLLSPAEAPERETFEVCAIREPYSFESIEIVPLVDSQYDRRVTVATLASPTGSIRVLTAHFDSGTESGTIRRRQLAQVAKLIGTNGVFAGDANLRKAEWEETKTGLGVTDAWEAAGEPDTTRYTWRRKVNGEDFKARFDRVLLGPGLTATSMSPLGTKPLNGRIEISDHIGLLVELEQSG